jgi:cell division septum initiation protein DivIVA
VNKSFQDWLSEGEQLYSTAAHEYQDLEQQIVALEQQLAAKRSEVNQIASVIGKPPIEGARRIAAQLLEEPLPQSTVPLGAIGRALSGRGGGLR